jgi:hypothetical protein
MMTDPGPANRFGSDTVSSRRTETLILPPGLGAPGLQPE